MSAIDFELSLLKYSLEHKDVDIDAKLFSEDRRVIFKIFRKYYDEYHDFPTPDTVKSIISEYKLGEKVYDTYTAIRLSPVHDKEYCIRKLQDEYFERLIQRGLNKYNASKKESKRERFEDFVEFLLTERTDVSDIPQGYTYEFLEEVWKDYVTQEANPLHIEGTPTHIKCIDKYLGGAVDGRFNVFFGLAKAGKTTLLMNIADNLATFEDEDVIFISGEMIRKELMMILQAKKAMMDSMLIRNGSLSEFQKKRFRESLAQQWERKAPFYIIEPEPNFMVGDIISYIRTYEKKYKPKKQPRIIIDYLWKMGTTQRYSGFWDKLEFITDEIYTILCKRMDYNVWSVTHEGLEGAKRKRDNLERGAEAVQGSSRIVPNVSALILMDSYLKKEELLNKMQMKCDANRHGSKFCEYVTYLKEFSYIGEDIIKMSETVRSSKPNKFEDYED